MKLPTLLFAALMLWGLPGCSPPPFPASPEDASTHVLHRLYFGRGMPEGREVSPAQWADFLRDNVTPRFPDGLTYWPAQGQWRSESNALGKENSFVLEIIVPQQQEHTAGESFRTIIDTYKQQFAQESVLWLRDPSVEVTFR